MSNTLNDALERVPSRVRDPQLIPAERYYDEEFFRLEKERLWPHVWQMACRLEEIPAIGDYVEYTILDKSVLIVRTTDGVKAFHNACRHRGVRLVTEPGNCAKLGFVCPFHGWRYGMDGENTFVFGRQIFDEKVLARDQIDLAPCRIDFWAGCAFINFDDEAPALRECLGPVAERMDARNADHLRTDWWCATVLPTNWKLAMEAFQEGYHVMRTHPQLHELTTPGAAGYDADAYGIPQRELTARQVIELNIDFMKRLNLGMAGMLHDSEVPVIEALRDMEVPEDLAAANMAFYAKASDEITRDGLARGAPMFDINKVNMEHGFHAVEYMFPNFFLLPMFGSMSSYRIRPLTPETCLFEIWSLTLRPDGEAAKTPRQPTVLPYNSPDFPEIPRQDYSNLPLQQLGLHAGKFTHMRLSIRIEGMISNYQRLIDGYLAGLDPQLLAKASQLASGGYEAPIRDLGF
jgi:phenylpropionate dioxygenase-like ring-hydroxylating dioxygenase large terminal subunit